MGTDRIIALILIALGLGLYWISLEFPKGANIFPQFSLGTIIFLAIIMFIMGLKKQETSKPQSRKPGWGRPYIIFALTTLYIVSITILGFFVATSAFIVGTMFYLGLRKLSSYVIALTIIILFYYVLFVRLLHVPLPQGLIF